MTTADALTFYDELRRHGYSDYDAREQTRTRMRREAPVLSYLITSELLADALARRAEQRETTQ